MRADLATEVRRTLLRQPSRLLAVCLLVLVTCAAVTAPLVAPYDPNAQDIALKNQPPMWSTGGSVAHVLGTDQLGRDLLSRLTFGSRVTMAVGLSAVLVATLFGSLAGLLAGYVGGWSDNLVMRLADIQFAFPSILLAIAVIGVLGVGVGNLIIVLAFTGWVQYARIMRAQVLSLREKEYVEAARALGAQAGRIMVRHILPNSLAAIVVVATLQFAQVIVTEAALSFLGLGVPLDTPSWGGMLNDGQSYLGSAWWVATLPGVAISLTVLSVNLMGDWLGDLLNPRLRR
jgi:peptide/nickel transport system permease protein